MFDAKIDFFDDLSMDVSLSESIVLLVVIIKIVRFLIICDTHIDATAIPNSLIVH